MPKILVVDDEPNIAELIRFILEKENYTVVSALDGLAGLAVARENRPNLIILDVMLPGKDGFEVCRTLKANPGTAMIPIVMLSARSELIDKILGLEIGADDYVTKPFSPRELLARIKANLRQREYARKLFASGDEKILKYNDIVIRPERHEVALNGNRVDLSPKEFEILLLLASHPGRVFTRNLLLEKIWGFDEVRETRTVDVHVRYLRQKIERNPASPEIIETVRGLGYRFNEKKKNDCVAIPGRIQNASSLI